MEATTFIGPVLPPLADGMCVLYSYEPRPNLICTHCETTSEDVGDPAICASFDGQIGVIEEIMNPKAPDVIRCKKCRGVLGSEHFLENGIAVYMKTMQMGHSGVWAYPSELTHVGEDAYWNAAPFTPHDCRLDQPSPLEDRFDHLQRERLKQSKADGWKTR